MADFLADNIRAQDAEPHAFLDGKLVVAPQKKSVGDRYECKEWTGKAPRLLTSALRSMLLALCSSPRVVKFSPWIQSVSFMCGRPSHLPQSNTLFLPLLQTELEKGRVAGPFPFPSFPSSYPDLHVSRCGVIPKKNQPGKWCLILHLSSPSGRTVNDGIPKEDFSVHYMKVDDIISGIMARGRGSLMAKFDVQSA